MNNVFLASTMLLCFNGLMDAQACPCSDKTCPCNSNEPCSCSAAAGKVCTWFCPCEFAFVKADAPAPTKAVLADTTGTAYFCVDGKQCGWLDTKTKVYRPYDAKTDTFGPACPCPAQTNAPVVQQPTWQQTYTLPFATSGGGCASCGSSSGGGRRR